MAILALCREKDGHTAGGTGRNCGEKPRSVREVQPKVHRSGRACGRVVTDSTRSRRRRARRRARRPVPARRARGVSASGSSSARNSCTSACCAAAAAAAASSSATAAASIASSSSSGGSSPPSGTTSARTSTCTSVKSSIGTVWRPIRLMLSIPILRRSTRIFCCFQSSSTMSVGVTEPKSAPGRAGLHVEAQLGLAEPLRDLPRLLEALRLVPRALLLALAELVRPLRALPPRRAGAAAGSSAHSRARR